MADIKRLQYHDGQLLDVSDFTAEQDYHLDMRKRHNRSIHGWGIVEGLEVKSDGKQITISPGMAIDKEGQELIVLQEMTPPLSAELKSTIRYITAKFEAVDDDTMEVKDKDDKKMYSRRTIERTKIEITETEPAKDGTIIVLAAIKWDAEGKITVDSAARSRSVSSRIDPAADFTVRSLSLGGDAAAPEEPLQIGKGGIDKNCFITLYSGGGKYGGIKLRSWDWGYGFTIQHQNAPMGLNILRHQKSGNGASALFITRDTGNIGIGTTDPKSTLSVKGGLAVGTTYAGTNAAPDNVLLVEGKVGIGITDPKSTLSVKGGLAVGTTYAGTNAAPDNVLLVEGKVGIGTSNTDAGKLTVADGTPLVFNNADNANRAQFRVSGENTSAKLHIDVLKSTGSGWQENALVVQGDGKVGIGVTGSGANLDVSGKSDTAGQISLQLRSGNTATNYASNQITLGYASTAQYRHAIKTRHHGGQTAGNAIDFYVWQYGTEKDAPDKIGGLHTMTLDGGDVGIGATGPQAKLDVNGDMIVSGPIKGRHTEEDLKTYLKAPKYPDIKDGFSYKKMITSLVKQNAAIIQGCSFTSGEFPPHFFAFSNGRALEPGDICIFDLTSGAAKTFIIDHPLHQDKYLMHATLEGPEGAVYYRGTARLNYGKVQIQLPDYFEALTRAEGRTILLTNVDGFDPLAVLTQDGAQIKDGRFIVVSSNKESNQAFDWEVKAIRKDVQALEVEPPKSAIKVERFGPYAYAVPVAEDRTRTEPVYAYPRSAEPQTGADSIPGACGPRSKITTIR